MKTCTGCGVTKSDKSFPADGRTTDNLSHKCAECRFGTNLSEDETRTALREFGMPHDVPAAQLPAAVAQARALGDDDALETVTLEHVPILSEGGPYYGTGSPPEGDYYTKADLEEIAANNRELAAEVKAANKIGHSKAQRLLANSGLSDDEGPAAGWLPGESFVVEEGDDGKWKLYADVVKVPAKLAKLFEAGAFRTRSVELSRVTSQTQTVMGADDTETTVPGKVYEAVVTGLAWLGAKAPAVRTLDDIYALYRGDTQPGQVVKMLYADAGELPAEVTRTVEYATDGEGASTAEIVWEPEDGFQDLSSDLSDALNPNGGDRRYWVQDVSVKLDKCIVNDWQSNATWIVPFTMGADGDPVPAPATEWVLAEQAWVKSADELAERNFGAALKNRSRAADTEVTMPDPIKNVKDFTDEQVVTLAKTFGIEGDKADELRPKLEEHMKAFGTDEPVTPPVVEPPAAAEPAADEATAREMAELRAKANLGERAYEDRRVEKREALITRALGDATTEPRILPAQVDDWRKFYDANPELAEAQIKALPPLPRRSFGSDEPLPTNVTTEDATKAGESAWAQYAAATGIPVEVGS